jgi:hypothetical protein
VRLGLFLSVPITAAVGLAAACSSFTSDPVVADAGTEAATSADVGASEAASGVDAALPPTPGVIECFNAQCKDGNDCCYDIDAGTTACTTGPGPSMRCGFGMLTLHCDEKSDCAPNETCCVGFFGNADCVPDGTCNGNSERLCHAHSECEVGSSCVQVPCRGTTIGACGPVGNTVKTFCKP